MYTSICTVGYLVNDRKIRSVYDRNAFYNRFFSIFFDDSLIWKFISNFLLFVVSTSEYLVSIIPEAKGFGE